MNDCFFKKNQHGCPFLFLAPMEGVGDQTFRKSMASIGGFDMAVRDFLRVPKNAYVKSLAKQYDANELGNIPLKAQIMGSDPVLMADMAKELIKHNAPCIDLNCGCPSNTVNGRGAGSSLLKDPKYMYKVAKSIVQAVDVPVSVKIRSGFEDTSLYKEILFAVEESGADYITIHPRTKVEGYTPPANWDLIAQAKSLLKIPVVGNGDILSCEDALSMLEKTNCDALMIGRGSIINPFIFKEIKAYFSKTPVKIHLKELEDYLSLYRSQFHEKMSQKNMVNKLKQLFGFLFKKNPDLLEKRREILRSKYQNPDDFMKFSLDLLLNNWN